MNNSATTCPSTAEATAQALLDAAGFEVNCQCGDRESGPGPNPCPEPAAFIVRWHGYCHGDPDHTQLSLMSVRCLARWVDMMNASYAKSAHPRKCSDCSRPFQAPRHSLVEVQTL